MNKKKTQCAARLYALATIAWMDAGGAESDEEADVVSVAIERARTELERIAPGALTMSSLAAVIDFVKSEGPR